MSPPNTMEMSIYSCLDYLDGSKQKHNGRTSIFFFFLDREGQAFDMYRESIYNYKHTRKFIGWKKPHQLASSNSTQMI